MSESNTGRPKILRPAEAPVGSSSRPIEIGAGRLAPAGTTGTAPARHIPFSAPVARIAPPQAPVARPRIPTKEPPAFDLPPSLPQSSIFESAEFANATGVAVPGKGAPEEANASDDRSGSSTQPIPSNPTDSGASSEAKRDTLAAPAKQQWGIARSLTNNTFIPPSMSCPTVDSSVLNKLGINIGKGGANPAAGAAGGATAGVDPNMIGRSPTIFSIMSGTDVGNLLHNTAGGAGGSSAGIGSVGSAARSSEPVTVSSRNPAFRAAAPPAATQGGRQLAASPEDEDEDEDEDDVDGREPQPLLEDDDLQFNITLDSS